MNNNNNTYIIILRNKIRLYTMTENEKFKSLYENAYNQNRQTMEINYSQFKNMIESAYLQHVQMIKANVSIMKSYSSMFGNKEIVSNIEKMESDFLTLNEQSKKSIVKQLDFIKDNYLSNAAKINEQYQKMPNINKFIPNPDGSVDSK